MFGERLAKHAATVETQLDQAMAPMGDTPVVQGMRYALRGGKRLRAFLVMQSAAIYDVPQSQSIWPAAAIEAIHAYSLVHDDLPCMDDPARNLSIPLNNSGSDLSVSCGG